MQQSLKALLASRKKVSSEMDDLAFRKTSRERRSTHHGKREGTLERRKLQKRKTTEKDAEGETSIRSELERVMASMSRLNLVAAPRASEEMFRDIEKRLKGLAITDDRRVEAILSKELCLRELSSKLILKT